MLRLVRGRRIFKDSNSSAFSSQVKTACVARRFVPSEMQRAAEQRWERVMPNQKPPFHEMVDCTCRVITYRLEVTGRPCSSAYTHSVFARGIVWAGEVADMSRVARQGLDKTLDLHEVALPCGTAASSQVHAYRVGPHWKSQPDTGSSELEWASWRRRARRSSSVYPVVSQKCTRSLESLVCRPLLV